MSTRNLGDWDDHAGGYVDPDEGDLCAVCGCRQYYYGADGWQCGCPPDSGCRLVDHDALRHDDAAWARCAIVGMQPGDPPLEFRNCPACHSTLAREVRP